jgi:hypothetical protein
VGVGRGQILGTDIIMENAILKQFCRKLRIDYEQVSPGYFPNQIRKLKEICDSRSNPYVSEKLVGWIKF